jgi:sulfoxide reductase heme-binding subunit YedZ
MTLWFLARAAGFVALLSASLTVALGAAGSSARRDGRIVAHLVHRSAAVVTLAMLALHGVLLVTDRFVNVSMAGALVPFTAGYRGVALGLGTLALYGFVVVALTGALRGRLAASSRAANAWRTVHVAAYAAWVLAMAHGVLAGTDTVRGWALALYGASAFVVSAAVVGRIASELRHRRSPLVRTRRLTALTHAGTR